MKPSVKSGLSLAAVAVILVLVLAAGVATVYVALTSGTPSSVSEGSNTSSSNFLSGSPSSTSSTITSSCSSTSIVGLNATGRYPSLIPLYAAYDSQSISYSITTGGNKFNSTETFNVIYRSSTTDKVTTTEVGTTVGGESVNLSETAWILKNGTVLAVFMPTGGGGVNETGAAATAEFVGSGEGFYLEVGFGENQPLLGNSAETLHSTGTSIVTISGSQVNVTSYAGSVSQAQPTGCSSGSVAVSVSLSIGTPAGATFPLVTSCTEDEVLTSTVTIGGNQVNSTVNADYAIEMTGFTVAS